MSIKKDETGRRWVEVEVEVPGTPKDVWKAIATGPGISSWFVPSEVEEREGGKAVSHFAPDGSMDSVAKITAWEPPNRFIAEAEGGPGTVATEWTVEAKSGGVCTVRVVHRWFASTDDWDDQFEGHVQGWVSFFRILQLYLAEFRGQLCASFQVMAASPKANEEAWAGLTIPLEINGASVGERVSAPNEAPPLAGTVQWAGQEERPEELLIQLDAPAPGIAHLFSLPMGDRVYLTVRFFLYGGQESPFETAARAEASWKSWFNEHFKSAGS